MSKSKFYTIEVVRDHGLLLSHPYLILIQLYMLHNVSQSIKDLFPMPCLEINRFYSDSFDTGSLNKRVIRKFKTEILQFHDFSTGLLRTGMEGDKKPLKSWYTVESLGFR